MELKNQVCTLEQAQELWKLGLRVKSVYRWRTNNHILDTYIQVYSSPVPAFGTEHHSEDETYPAHSVAELGEMLRVPAIEFLPRHDGLNWSFNCDDYLSPIIGTEARARAALLIHLIKEGMIKIDDLNTANNL